MKKNLIHLLALCLLLSFNPFNVQAITAHAPISLHTAYTGDPTPPSTALLNRLTEIQSLDKSKMTGREKRALRKEVRSIKKGLGELSGGGVYLSVGAIIIIILLLILIL